MLVPKIEDTDTLAEADRRAGGGRASQRASRPAACALLAILETPRGIAHCDEILDQAPDRTVTAIFGLGDFSVALGVELTRDGAELAYARGKVVVATRAAGMVAPIDGPYLDVEDADGLLTDSRRQRTLGFQGRSPCTRRRSRSIHRAYSELTDEEAARTRRVVEAFEEAESRGVASLRLDGRFVDYPIYYLARRKLTRFEAYSEAEGPAVMSAQPLALEGIRVVDAASLFAGPVIATMLGDFGADVIKVEHPDRRQPAQAGLAEGRRVSVVGPDRAATSARSR